MLLCGNSLCLALGCLWSLQQEHPMQSIVISQQLLS